MELADKIVGIQNKIYEFPDTIDFSQYDDCPNNVQILLGKKTSGRTAKPPLVAVWLTNAEIDNAGSSIHSEWEFRLHIMGLYKTKNVQKGREISTRLTAITVQEYVMDRNLQNHVRDIVIDEFIVGDERQEVDKHVFGGYARLLPRFRWKPPRK